MKIRYVDRFIWKTETMHYPLQGYWYQLASKSLTSSIYYNQFSDLHAANTFVENDALRMSIDFYTELERENQYNYIYIYSLDLLAYSSIVEIKNSKESLMSQLAAIIDLENTNSEDHVINQYTTCIIDLGYMPKCSFKLNAADEQVQVDHYNSDYVDKINFYAMNVDDQLIDYESGVDYARVNLANYTPEDLVGNMTIRKSGIIQL